MNDLVTRRLPASRLGPNECDRTARLHGKDLACYGWFAIDFLRYAARFANETDMLPGWTVRAIQQGWGTKGQTLHLQAFHPRLIGDPVEVVCKAHASVPTRPHGAEYRLLRCVDVAKMALEALSYQMREAAPELVTGVALAGLLESKP